MRRSLGPQLADLVKAQHDGIRRAVAVSVACKVEAFDAAGPTVDVRPLVREVRLRDREWIDVPSLVIKGVPVAYMGGSKRGITFGFDAGDEVMLLVRHQSHDEIDSNARADSNGTVSPKLKRRLDLSDGIVVAGFERPGADRNTDHYREDGQLVIYMASGEKAHVGASDADKALALAEKVDARLEDLRQVVNDHAQALSSVGGHTHTWSGTGSGTTSPPSTNFGPTLAFDPTDCDDMVVRS